MKCLHHNDYDGICAAYWVSKRFDNKNPIDFIMMDYDSKIDWLSQIKDNEKVIIVDFSLTPDDMRKLLKKTKDVIWIDHHISAIEKYNDFEIEIPGLRYNGIAGCLLTYCYFFEMEDGKKEFDPKMTVKAPWMTKYIADWDVWKFDYEDETREFVIGLDTISNINPISPIWEHLQNIDEIKRIKDRGRICIQYRDTLALRAVEQSSFEADIDGHKALCMNLNDAISNSTWFGDNINDYDLVCAFSYTGDHWTYSLYCSDYAAQKKGINCGKIAQKMHPNGGGHVQAAGFQTDKCIFG